MRRVLRVLFGRGALTVFCLAVQLLALWGAARLCGGTWLRTVMTIGAFAAVVGIISGKREAGYKTAWCVLVLAVPVFGLLCYALLGGSRRSRALRQLHDVSQRYLEEHLPPQAETFAALAVEAPEAAAQSIAIRHLCGAPVWFGGEVRWFSEGDACFRAMLEDLRSAERSIWLEYFIIRPGVMWDSILTIARKKAENGVDVRVIYDDFGCLPGFPADYPDFLREMGIECRVCNPFLPVLSAGLGSRDHRKLLIVDGDVCYTGGINLSDEYIGLRQRCGHWKDGAARLTGAAVYGCSALFSAMWTALGGEAVPPPQPKTVTGEYCYVQPLWDSPLYAESVGRSAITGMIGRAQKRVALMTPYLVPDEALCASLCLAAASGVQVQLITPGVGDKRYAQAITRAHYARLMEAGVRIYEYTPGFLHSKVCCADGAFALVGTVNLDYRSFYLQFENGLWLYGQAAVSQIEADFDATLSQCCEITPQYCASLPWPRRAARAVLRLFAPLV